MNVPTARVGDVAEQIRGVTYNKDDVAFVEKQGYLPILRAGNITEHGLTFDDLVFVPEKKVSLRQRIRQYDVLIAASSGSLDVVGKAAQVTAHYSAGFGAFCKVLRPRPTVDPGYFSHFFKTADYRRRVARLAEGININNLRSEHLNDLEIPMPPLAEQGRISRILDQAEAIRARRRAAVGLLDSLGQSMFLDVFGDPVRNPRNWPVRPFGDVCQTRLGKMLDIKRQTGLDRRPYLRNANVRWFEFDLSEVLEMDFDEDERELLRLERGDLLICEGGEPGRAAIWRGELDECYFQKALHRARPDAAKATPEYLAWLLWFLVKKKAVVGVTSATIAHLTGEKLAVLPTMLPPLNLQKDFVERLRALDRVRSRSRESLSMLDELYASLQHRAFRGELI